MKKIFMKKGELKKVKKCPRNLKQWVLRCPSEKKKYREMNKIAPIL